MNLYEFIRDNNRVDLLLEWDREGNGDLTPDMLTPGSHKMIAWRCERGHRWNAALYSRTNHRTGCPYCTGRKLYTGHNDLLTKHPALIQLWSDRNEMGPESISPGSHKAAWWRCRKGHEWKAAVYSVAGGCGCPYCAKRLPMVGETDLKTTDPELAALWDYERNEGLTPQDVVAGATRMVWWKCENGYDHSYQSRVYSRTAGCGCPYCSGKKVLAGFNDLRTTDPELAVQWADETMKATEVNRSSHKKVAWRCGRGHVYKASVYSRVAGNGCPYCAGRKVLKGFNDLATTHAALAEEWYQPLNGELTPQTVSKGSNQKVWWRCHYGHIWQAAVFARARDNGTGCPICAGKGKAKGTAVRSLNQELELPTGGSRNGLVAASVARPAALTAMPPKMK